MHDKQHCTVRGVFPPQHFHGWCPVGGLQIAYLASHRYTTVTVKITSFTFLLLLAFTVAESGW